MFYVCRNKKNQSWEIDAPSVRLEATKRVGLYGQINASPDEPNMQKRTFVAKGTIKPTSRSRFVHSFPNKPWFLGVCSTSLLKTVLEKEKLLITSNFSFCHIVFYLFGELSAIYIKFEILSSANILKESNIYCLGKG